jgi:membrane-bound lytic murein transglycosylase D
MESTGKTYLRVDADVDERRDPLLATYAAAQFLKHTYDALESWPLVINAYNTGHGRLLQAIKALGTRDIARIITEFKHPDYQFASRNFYPEFLAALEVYRRKEVFFAEVKPRVPLRYDTVSFERPVSVPLIAQYAGIPLETLRELNPSFSDRLLQGMRALTPDLALKVPYLSGDRVAMVAGRLNRLKGIAFREGLLETEGAQVLP